MTKSTAGRVSADEKNLSWKLVKGDYKNHEGDWKLTPFDGNTKRTLVVYTALVVPKLSVPDGMLKSGQRRELPAVIKGIRKAARQVAKR